MPPGPPDKNISDWNPVGYFNLVYLLKSIFIRFREPVASE